MCIGKTLLMIGKNSTFLIFGASGPELPYLDIFGSKHIFIHILAENYCLIVVEGSNEAYW